MTNLCFIKNDKTGDNFSIGFNVPCSVIFFDGISKITDVGDLSDYYYPNRVSKHLMRENVNVDLTPVDKSNLIRPKKWADIKVSLEIGFNLKNEPDDLLAAYELYSGIELLLYDGKSCLVSLNGELIMFDIEKGCAINIATNNPQSSDLDEKIIASLVLALVSDIANTRSAIILSQEIYNILTHNESTPPVEVEDDKPVEVEAEADYFDGIQKIFAKRGKNHHDV